MANGDYGVRHLDRSVKARWTAKEGSLRILAILWILLWATACSPTKAIMLAKEATVQFHLRASSGDDDAIYARATSEFQQVSTREYFVRLNSKIRRIMGKCVDFEVRSSSITVAQGKTFVTLQVRTKCANGPLDEVFTWLIENERAALARYTAQSQLFVLE